MNCFPSSPTKSDRELEEELTGKKAKKTPKKVKAATTAATPTTTSSTPAATPTKKSAVKAKKKLELEDESAKTLKKVREFAPSGGAMAAQKHFQQSQKQSQESHHQKQAQKLSQEAQKSLSEEVPEEDYIPTEKEEEMQNYLQDFALALLETNPSWSARAVIQNLVIWEPVGPVIPMKKVCTLRS